MFLFSYSSFNLGKNFYLKSNCIFTQSLILTNLRAMGKFLRDFFQNTNIILPAVIIFIFLYFQKAINLFIETFLMSDPSYNTWYLQLVMILAFISSFVLLFKKLITNKYLPAPAEYSFISLLSVLLLYYRFNWNGLNWNLHAIVENRWFSIKYIDLALVSSSFLLRL